MESQWSPSVDPMETNGVPRFLREVQLEFHHPDGAPRQAPERPPHTMIVQVEFRHVKSILSEKSWGLGDRRSY